MDTYVNKNLLFKRSHRVDSTLICFSDEAQKINNYLETVITSKVINSSEVSLFDSNAAVIVSSLFKAYYENPKLMDRMALRWLTLRIREYTPNVVDFESGNFRIVQQELDKISNMDLSQELSPKNQSEEASNTDAQTTQSPKTQSDEASSMNWYDRLSPEGKEYYRKRWILVRTVCDFISGMTDTYAQNAYHKLAKKY